MFFTVDYATSGSSKKLVIAFEHKPPMFYSGTLLEFVSGQGTGEPANGHNRTRSEQTSFLEKGRAQWNPEQGHVPPRPSPGDTIVIESNFEPHNPQERNAVIDKAAERDICIVTLPPRTTGKIKKILDGIVSPEDFERGYVEKYEEWCEREGLVAYKHDDFRAVEAIRWCYLNGQTVAAPKKAAWDDKSQLQILQALRTAGLLSDNKHPWVRDMLARLPSTLMITDMDIAEVYIQDREWQRELVFLTIIATDETNTRDEFDRWLGLYGNGYARIPRSSFIRRAVSLAKRDCPDLPAAWVYARKLYTQDQHAILKSKMRQVRRATRKMRQWLKE